MTENGWIILVCSIVMVGWLIGVGIMIYKRKKEKKKEEDKKNGDE